MIGVALKAKTQVRIPLEMSTRVPEMSRVRSWRPAISGLRLRGAVRPCGRYAVTKLPSRNCLLENAPREARADLFPGVDRDGDHPPALGVNELTMTALTVALLREAGGLQAAHQLTPRTDSA